jgi:chemotaxis protein methyltransferase CheR
MSALQSRALSPPRASGYSDPAFARIADLAHVHAGLVFPPNRQPSAEAGMRRAMSALRVNNPAELLRLFQVPGASRDAVLAELTVGESYFFREAAQLDLLVTDIMPAHRVADTARPLSVWSAGCASGEEPHTVAIMLREQGCTNPSRILATDIARPRLAAAQRGRYTRWALRGVSDERIDRWFTRNGTYYDLTPAIREMVEFRAFNLVVDDYATAGGGEPFDLILCRNVMIYFDLPTVARIAAGLLDSLAPDGWLVLGASDPPLAHLVPCEAIMTPSGMAYRRAGTVSATRRAQRASSTAIESSSAASLPTAWIDVSRWTSSYPADVPPILPASASSSSEREEASVAPLSTEPRETRDRALERQTPDDVPTTDAAPDALAVAYQSANYQAAESIVARMLALEPDIASATWITYIRSVANQGRLHEAGALNARALEHYPLDAELHYLHATLLMEAGWFVDAAAAVRRAIYLDRKLTMGHLLLGEALSRTGNHSGARNAFANALQLLDGIDGADTVRAADGVTASRLRQIATLRLRDVEASAR